MSDDSTMKDDTTKETTNTAEAPPTEEPNGDPAVTNNAAEATTETETQEEDLATQLEKALTQAADYLDGWQRARAEFANFRKRVEREQEDSFINASISVMEQLLPIIDDLDRAIDNQPEDIADHNWVQGITMIGQKFHTLLENKGLEIIDPVGEAFDPARHEAVGTDDSDEVESGHVTQVLLKGYVYRDRVVRAALVRVAN